MTQAQRAAAIAARADHSRVECEDEADFDLFDQIQEDATLSLLRAETPRTSMSSEAWYE